MKSFKPTRIAAKKIIAARKNPAVVSDSSDNKKLIRSMLRLRNKTVNRFKTIEHKPASPKASPKASPSKFLPFTAVSTGASTKPSSPVKMLNAPTGTLLVVKNPKHKYSYFKHLLRNHSWMNLRTGNQINTMPVVRSLLAC